MESQGLRTDARRRWRRVAARSAGQAASALPVAALSFKALMLAVLLAGAMPARAQPPASAVVDLGAASRLMKDGRFDEAYALLLPFEAAAVQDAALQLMLGEAALRGNRPDAARLHFGRALSSDPDSAAAHLGLGRSYVALGDYPSARIAFETVLRFEGLPADQRLQAKIYAKAAEEAAAGKRLLGFGYAMVGGGNYRVNATIGTDTFGGSDESDNFASVRVGGGLNYTLSEAWSLDGSLDFRFRRYDNADRRDDRDLRWNGAASHSAGESNLIAGVRGRASYRGEGFTRNDFGAYGEWRYRLDEDNQIALGAELRQRRYPSGRLRERTRNIAELTAGWTRALFDGKASFEIVANGGREFNTERPDGDSNFFGLLPTLSFTINEKLGGFIFGFWQNDRYNIERVNIGAADEIVGITTRNDDLYELGGGLTWQLTQALSLNPEILYVRDRSNIIAVNYSSTEVWITARWDF